MGCDGAEDVVVATNTLKKASSHSNLLNSVSIPEGVICAKASMLLQVSSEWADYNIDAYSASSLKAGSASFPGLMPTRFSGSQTIMHLAHTVENEEVRLYSISVLYCRLMLYDIYI